VRELVLIAAVARNGVIGVDGDLPWRIPEDLKHFRRSTLGHAVIMGRRTWDSLGRPLPGRRNLVVSRDRSLSLDGAEVFASIDAALEAAWAGDDAPRVIGGATLYAATLPRATELILTEVDQAPEGDTRFPPFDRARWQEVSREPHDGFAFVTWRRGLDERPETS
jgi:dihydrofolate reductase